MVDSSGGSRNVRNVSSTARNTTRNNSCPHLPARALASIDRKIEAEGMYDAHQLIRTLYFRYISRNEENLAIELCRHYALKFATLKQEELAVELSGLILKTVEDSGMEFAPEDIDLILSLFNAILSAGGNGDEKYKFINRALKWSVSSKEPYGNISLHRAAADAYLKEKRYGLCQGHLIYCKDANTLSAMIREWETAGYKKEGPFFWLRATLILLCLKDVETATRVLEQCGQDWNMVDIPAPFQLAYLLTAACQARDEKFFAILKQKYFLLLRRDDSFQKYLAEIEKRVIGHSPNPAPGLASFFSSIAAGMSSDDRDA